MKVRTMAVTRHKEMLLGSVCCTSRVLFHLAFRLFHALGTKSYRDWRWTEVWVPSTDASYHSIVTREPARQYHLLAAQGTLPP